MKANILPLQDNGMSRDMSISKADKGFAFENHNIRILSDKHDTLMSVTSERGNKEIPGLEFKGVLVGWNTLNNFLILFTVDGDTSYIYRVKYDPAASEDKQFTSVLIHSGNMGFDVEHPIESITDYENEDIQKIYWIDGKNVLRFMNFSDKYLNKHAVSSPEGSTGYDFTDDWFDSNKAPKAGMQVDITRTNDGNPRANGTVQYFITYYNKNGIETSWAYASPLIYLSPEGRGGAADQQCTTKVLIKVTDCDPSFDYLRLYGIETTSYNGTRTGNIIAESEIKVKMKTGSDGIAVKTGEAIFVDAGKPLSSVDVSEILYLGSREVCPSTMAQKDGTLFLGDITLKENTDISRLVIAIKENAFTDNEWESNIVSFTFSDDNGDIPLPSADGYYPYESQLVYPSSSITTFKGGEKYRFALRFRKPTGAMTRAFWIGDKTNNLYPMTDYRKIKRPLAVCSLPRQIAEIANSLGYTSCQLMIANATYSDRSVLAQGFVSPTVFNLYDRYSDQPFVQSSWIFRPQNGGASFQHMAPIGNASGSSGELQCNWWPTDESDSDNTPSPVLQRDTTTGEVINPPTGYKEFTHVKFNCNFYVEAPKWMWLLHPIGDVGSFALLRFFHYYGYLHIEYARFENNDPSSKLLDKETYDIKLGHDGKIGNPSKNKVVADFLEAMDEYDYPLNMRPSREVVSAWCVQARKNYKFFKNKGHNYVVNPDPENGGREWNVVSFTDNDVTRRFTKFSREYYFVDENIVTLNSPEIEYERINLDREGGLKFRIIGVARMTSNITDYSITAKNTKYVGEGQLSENFSKENISDNTQGLLSFPLYVEAGLKLNDEDKAPFDIKDRQASDFSLDNTKPCVYMVYPWQKDGSLIGYTSNGSDKDADKTWSQLEKKIIANLHYAYYSLYNLGRWEADPLDVRQFTDLARNVYELKTVYGKKIYSANIDSMVMMPTEVKYPVFYSINSVKPGIDLNLRYDIYSSDPVRLRYDSKAHAVISFPLDKNGKQIILPRMFDDDNSDTVTDSNKLDIKVICPWNTVRDDVFYSDLTNMDAKSDSTDKGNLTIDDCALRGMQITEEDNIVKYSGLDDRLTDPMLLLSQWQSMKAKMHITDIYKFMTVTDDKPILVNVGDASCTNLSITMKYREGLKLASGDQVVQNPKFLDVTIISDAVGLLEFNSIKAVVSKDVTGTYEYTFPDNIHSSSHSFSIPIDVYEFIVGPDRKFSIDFSIIVHAEKDDKTAVENISLKKNCVLAYRESENISALREWEFEYIGKLFGIGTYYNLDEASQKPIYNLADDEYYMLDKYEFVKQKNDRSSYIESAQTPIDMKSKLINDTSSYIYIGELYKDYDSDPSTDTRYGGITEAAIESNTFIPASEFTPISSDADNSILGNQGDTYFQRWDSVKTLPHGKTDENQVVDIVSAMIETHVNLDGRTDLDRGVTDLEHVDYAKFGKINDVYSQEDNLLSAVNTDEQFDTDNYKSSVTWTLEKKSGSETDNWTHITLASMLPLDGGRGIVRAIRRFNNSLFAFQDRGVCEILFNSRTQVSTQEGVPIEIANSGKVDGKRYISTNYGCTNKWSIVEGKAGLYFIDDLNQEIITIGGEGLDTLSSKAKMDSWLKLGLDKTKPDVIWKPTTEGKQFTAYYDRVRSDVYFIKWNDPVNPCLVYNEKLGAFAGFFDYQNMPMLCNVYDRLLSFRDGKLWLQNEGLYCNFFGKGYPFWITYRAMAENGIEAIWTNAGFRGDFHKMVDETGKLLVDIDGIIDGDPDAFDSYVPDETFDSISVWNEYQKTGEFKVEWKPRIGETYPDVRKKFRIWNIDIPRAVKDAMNKFGLDRIRNPWIYMKLKKSYGDGTSMLHLHDMYVKYFTEG